MKNKVIKYIAIISLILVLLIVATLVGGYIWLVNSKDYVKFDSNRLNNINNTLTILDKNDKPITSAIYINGLKQVSGENLNQYTLDAFIAIEDKRFYEHKGLDYRRMAGALISNIKSRSYKEGASTISQQLIKNTHLDNEKTIKRKLNEILLARELEKNYSKREILEMYVNTIYFGHSAYGIENASKIFFNKSATELTLSESAMLAGIIKSPANYSPLKHYDNCINRRNVVLHAMRTNGFIDAEQYITALEEKPQVNNQSDGIAERDYCYAVIEQASELLNMSQVQLLNSNMTIHTYYDSEIQQALENSIKSDTTKYRNSNKPVDCLGIIADNSTSGIRAFYVRGNRSINEKRQVGSTIKPFAVYAPAIQENQITQASMLLDEKTNFNGYQPHNYGDTYKGWITVKEALKRSSNICAVKTLNNLGVKKSCDYLSRMGLDIQAEQNLSMALGNFNGGMTAKELLTCYGTLANNGVYNEMSFIKSITNAKGDVYRHKSVNKKVFSAETDFLITDMLQETATSGTAKILKSNYAIAGKTGTVGNSQGNSDAIVSGYTTQHTFCIWLSGQKNNLDNSVTGGNVPCSIAKSFLDNIYSKNKPSNFKVPAGVIKQSIDKVALNQNNQLLIAGSDIPTAEKITFYFNKKNCAKQFSQRIALQSLDIEVSYQDNTVTIILPKTEYNTKLYRLDSYGNKAELNHNGLKATDVLTEKGDYSYFAEFYSNERVIQKSKTHTVKIANIFGNNPTDTDNYKEKDNTSNNNINGKEGKQNNKLRDYFIKWLFPNRNKPRN